jgi:multiple sugar transport system substrate-binding protein
MKTMFTKFLKNIKKEAVIRVRPLRGRTLSGSFAKLGLLLGVVALFGAGCGKTNAPPASKTPISIWGIFDDAEGMDPFLKTFSNTELPGAKVSYRKQSPVDQYENQLLSAIAENRGPDVFLIHSSWLPRWKNRILPAPVAIMNEKQVNEQYVDLVSKDVIASGRVMALPLFMDTLALYYNKDIFNASGVTRAPKTWAEVMEIVKRTTKSNMTETNQIDQSGIAMGTGQNVNRASDLLSILMMQNGVAMLDGDGNPGFGDSADAVRALQFYTDFANPTKDVYAWNTRSDYSIDAFATNKSAMMINYSYHMATIKAKNPRLNFAIAPLPQVENCPTCKPVTYGGYWLLAVSKQTISPDTAWRFVKFMSNTAANRDYLQKTGYPPARKDLIQELQNDPRIGVYTVQALNAESWKQVDSRLVDRLFSEAIDEVVTGKDTADGALRRASQQLKAATETMKAQGNTTN